MIVKVKVPCENILLTRCITVTQNTSVRPPKLHLVSGRGQDNAGQIPYPGVSK